MADILIPGAVFDRAKSALQDLLRQARPVPIIPEPEPPITVDPELELHVNSISGDDGNDGLRPGSAFRSFKRMPEKLQPRTRVILGDGFYREQLRLIGLGERLKGQPVWIKAENPGKATLTATDGRLASMRAQWTPRVDGMWATPFSGPPWAGFSLDRFLFLYKSARDLKAGSVGGVTKPRYGIAYEDGRLFVRLPDGADPRDTPVIVTAQKAANLAVIKGTPNVIIDGIRFAGAGQTSAISIDENSTGAEIRNCTAELCRMLAHIPSDSIIRWCRYQYPGFLVWAEEIGDVQSVFKLCKKYAAINGNAPYEGRLAAASGFAERCLFEYNLGGPAFDTSALGQFSDSISSNNVWMYPFDDGAEMENWRRDRPSRNLVSIGDWTINALGPDYSIQDTARQIEGPITVRRAVMIKPDPMAAPAHNIKLIGPYAHDPEVTFDRCFFHNRTGRTGWGLKNYLFLDHKKARGVRLTIRNSVVVMDRIDESPDFSADCDWNVVVADRPYPEIQGPNGRFFRSIDELKLRGLHEDIWDVRPTENSR